MMKARKRRYEEEECVEEKWISTIKRKETIHSISRGNWMSISSTERKE
jgi:hypothetical protein